MSAEELCRAAAEGDVELVTSLIQNINVDSVNEDEQTALVIAADAGHLEVCQVLIVVKSFKKVLIANGAAVNPYDGGMSPLMAAAARERIACMEILLANAADLQYCDSCDRSVLGHAVRKPDSLRLLINRGANVNQSYNNTTVLHQASNYGAEASVAVLCDAGADLEARDSEGRIPLHCAAKSGYAACCTLLVDRGSPINARDNLNRTPLMLAAHEGDIDTVDALLLLGPDTNAFSVSGTTAMAFAAGQGRTECVEHLLRARAHTDVPNCAPAGSWSALMSAAENSHLECVQLLLKAGASTELRNIDGRTALLIAAEEGHAEVVQALLRHGVNADAVDQRGHSALELANRKRHRPLMTNEPLRKSPCSLLYLCFTYLR